MYDIVIIGCGPAGMSAALYSFRKGLKILLITDDIGGQVSLTSTVENYLGFSSIQGYDLSQKFFSHIKNFDIELKQYVLVEKVEDFGNYKEIYTEDGNVYKTKTVIIATGAKHRELGVVGEKEFQSRGVSYCVTCDGPLYSGKDVIICGGGNSAVEAAIDISKIARNVTLIHRSDFRADSILLENLKKIENIKIYLQTQVKEIFGDSVLKGIKIFNKNTCVEDIIYTDAVFVEIGLKVDTDWLYNLVDLNEKGEIIVDKECRTSAAGIFAAGDVTNSEYKQIIIATGDGARAALSANEYINKNR